MATITISGAEYKVKPLTLDEYLEIPARGDSWSRNFCVDVLNVATDKMASKELDSMTEEEINIVYDQYLEACEARIDYDPPTIPIV